jgi:hypothetical protein
MNQRRTSTLRNVAMPVRRYAIKSGTISAPICTFFDIFILLHRCKSSTYEKNCTNLDLFLDSQKTGDDAGLLW